MVKGYKVTDTKRNRIVGVACSNLKELIKKGSAKLQISEVLEVHLQDGTVVDDEQYFQTIPSQTLLIFRRPNEEVMTGADIIYNALKCINKDILRAGIDSKRFLDNNVKEKIEVLSRILPAKLFEMGDVELTKFSNRKDHPDWFKDLETNARTKEEFMMKRCKARIQGYFYDSRAGVRKNTYYKTNVKAKRLLEQLFNEFSVYLKSNGYFGWYFDRKQTEYESYCKSEDGTFECQGLWNIEKCAYDFQSSDHRINPYSSREARILFGMWNLDHRIERSRTVVPAMIDASKMCLNRTEFCRINAQYFASLLFTKSNLKLVHIVCHDKGHHKDAVCDPEQFVLKDEDSVDNNTEKIKRKFVNSDPEIYNEVWDQTIKKRCVEFDPVISQHTAIT